MYIYFYLGEYTNRRRQNSFSGRQEYSSSRDRQELCILTKSKIIDLLGDNYKRASEASFAIPATNKSKLPILHLPNSDGKYAEYKNFIFTFRQLVHNDSSLCDNERFNHLLHCLSGQALDTVRAFESNGLIDERYNNKTLIFLEHISNIYELPSVESPSAMQLRALVDNASAVYSSLKSLGNEEDICNAMPIHLILTIVDSESNMKWKETIDFSNLPSWEEFTKVLERRCQYLESIKPQTSSSTNSTSLSNSAPQAAVNTHINNNSSSIIFATAIILVSDSIGGYKLGRVLLDSCSQVNLITEKYVNILNLSRRNISIDVSGVGGIASNMKYEVTSTVRSCFNNHECYL
ncbi:hypothetical protein CVS40_12848 [Lucilia cuprina]|nr:hypothetical protein CVS40_12848 [Lucilia cuprina]